MIIRLEVGVGLMVGDGLGVCTIVIDVGVFAWLTKRVASAEGGVSAGFSGMVLSVSG